jgi:hypothetical protein
MRNGLIVLWILLCSVTTSTAQVSVGIGLPGVSIGINLPVYPTLVPVPGYPVYYAPQVNSNYFFYDGLYWVYQRDNWYASSWYNGPWGPVAPEAVRCSCAFLSVITGNLLCTFRGWRSDASPRWGEHWGNTWEQRRSGWDTWDRGAVPTPAPLPVYQRQYSGNRYPPAAQQQVLQTQNYRYQPHDAVVQQHYQAQQVQSAPVASPQTTQVVTQQRSSPQQVQRASSQPNAIPPPPAPHGPPLQKTSLEVQKPVAAQPQQRVPAAQHQSPPPPPTQAAAQHEQKVPKAQGQDKGPQGKGPEPKPNQSQEKRPEKNEQQGGEHNK